VTPRYPDLSAATLARIERVAEALKTRSHEPTAFLYIDEDQGPEPTMGNRRDRRAASARARKCVRR
jgi:hypothetical protein